MKNILLKYSLIIALIVPQNVLAAAWVQPERAPKVLADILASVKAGNSNTFFVDCGMGDNLKAALFIRPGELYGHYFLLGDRGADGLARLAAQGEFSMKGGVSVSWWSLPDKEGGEHILGSLVRQPFRLLLSNQTDIIFKQAPAVSCDKPQFNK